MRDEVISSRRYPWWLYIGSQLGFTGIRLLGPLRFMGLL
jgi:hypothetical protein